MNGAVTTWRINHERTIRADRPLCIGILNITPDSFSDAGAYTAPASAIQRARDMIEEGASALDIGGESTRPGAQRVSEPEQISRVVPVIGAIRRAGIDAPITIDTTRAAVARAALDAGADAINDVSAATDDGRMLGLAAQRRCGLILMHRLAPPGQDRYSDRYQAPPIERGIVGHVADALRARRDAALDAGADPGAIMLDPGLGFGKDVAQNLRLISATPVLTALGHPVLSALSRKSFVGRVSLGRDSDPSQRLWGTLALSVLHLQRGARFFRVHDVAAHRQALDAAWAMLLSRDHGT